MTDATFGKLIKEKSLMESLLSKEIHRGCDDAKVMLEQLKPYFEKIDAMQNYKPIGRIRMERFLLDSELAKNKELLNCYGRFANLVEGISV